MWGWIMDKDINRIKRIGDLLVLPFLIFFIIYGFFLTNLSARLNRWGLIVLIISLVVITLLSTKPNLMAHLKKMSVLLFVFCYILCMLLIYYVSALWQFYLPVWIKYVNLALLLAALAIIYKISYFDSK